MCTVSYLPLHPADKTGKNGGYILTSNRDEAPHRNAIEIRRLDKDALTLLYPVDSQAGGTWFCISNTDRAACLLNGAYEPFLPNPRFTHSRGLMVLDFMQYPTVEDFVHNYDLALTAPFTLVAVVHDTLEELVWDSNTVRRTTLDPGIPAFWSSATLYAENVRIWRKGLFKKWLASHDTFAQTEIMDFHRYGSGEDIWNGFVMNRKEQVKTLSISSVRRQDGLFELVHHNLTTGATFTERMELNASHAEKD